MTIILVLLLACIGIVASDGPTGGTGGQPKPSCLNGADHVLTPTGQKRIDELKLGDRIAVNEGKFEPVISFLHRDVQRKALGYRFSTSNGTELTLSGEHLIFITPNRKAVLAKNVKPGDRIYTSMGKDEETVMKVDRSIMEGLYSPLTPSGVLIVNQVLVSCYSQIEDHHLMHHVTKWLAPIALSERVFGADGIVQNQDGLHWFGDVLWNHLRHWFIASRS